MKGRDLLTFLSIKYNGQWDEIYEAIRTKRDHIKDDEVNKALANINSKYVTIIDEDYPTCLKDVGKPPFVLFYYGDINLISDNKKCIGVIGMRNCSEYGRKMTKAITNDLAKDFVIVSGMAKGIDSLAHECAITMNGKTVAVLGSGIDNCYPKEKKELYDEIKKNHLLISEYPGLTPPEKDHFPFRNRLIAAFSRAIVLTEAKYRSGSSITVAYALEMGKSICCVPTHANEESLCNRLISDGARLIEKASDVYDEIGYRKESEQK